MPKKATDPFMAGLWDALVADQHGPGGNRTAWAETPVRVRNRFIAAVRQILQSGAAFHASAIELGNSEKTGAPAGGEKTGTPAGGATTATRGRRKAKPHDPRELQLPLLASVDAADKKRGR